MLAGLAVGFWEDTSELSRSWQEDQLFQPQQEQGWRQEILARWLEAISKV
jgi:glycerol kinase